MMTGVWACGVTGQMLAPVDHVIIARRYWNCCSPVVPGKENPARPPSLHVPKGYEIFGITLGGWSCDTGISLKSENLLYSILYY